MTGAGTLPRRNPTGAGTGATADDAIFLFAFVGGAEALRQHVPDATLERRLVLHRVRSVAALSGIVPISDYCGGDAERRLADVSWLAPRVRRHAELVGWAMRWSPVYPAPFGTLYASFDTLSAFMHAHEHEIASFLRDIADKEEWDLRATAHIDRPDVLDELACGLWPDWRSLPKGTRYMRLCRDRNVILARGLAEAAELVAGLVAELRPLTSALRELVSSTRPEPEGRELVARHALLVPTKNVAALRARIEEITQRAARQHVAMALSGPWPPFSFRPNLSPPRHSALSEA